MSQMGQDQEEFGEKVKVGNKVQFSNKVMN